MEELRTVLLGHAARYPQMEPRDGVKLIYQNEFGGGHLIRDEQVCLQYLAREYAAVEKNPRMIPAEDIGNGILRVNLAALPEEKLPELGQAFLRSAAAHRGSMARFLEKLEVLKELTAQGVFSFDAAALEDYLKDYEEQGYPPVSHSEAYRKAYRPAYRIIKKGEF